MAKIILTLFFIGIVYSENGPVRKTLYGQIRGKETSRIPGKNVEEYLGVPYASPPIGSLRFKRPVDPSPWKPETLATTTIPPSCPTHNLVYIQIHKDGFNRTDEDCLYMNIYVPKTEEKDLPVLLYIHGGDNADGMGAMFDGDILAAFGEIIVITINYRISVLGFYADKNEGIRGNNGLLDQVKAMEWVRDNIQYFNGDPTKLTIHGHSAGAADVGLHLISDLSKGLFRYAIIHSGSPLAYWQMSDCVQNSRNLVPNDCKPGTSQTSKKVRNKIKTLVNNGSIDEFMSSIKLGDDAFRVVIDGQFVVESVEQTLRCSPVNADSVLLVMAKDEGFEPRLSEIERFYTDKTVDDVIKRHKHVFHNSDNFEARLREAYENWKQNNISSFPHYLAMTADVSFFVPMVKLADLISKWMKSIYVLSFEYVSQDIPGPDWIGVQHGWDLFYLFGLPLVGHHSHPYYTERDKEVSKSTMKLFSNYIKYGYLSLNKTEKLPTYNSSLKDYNKLYYNNGMTVLTHENHFRGPRIDFWYKQLFPNEFIFTCKAFIGRDLSIIVLILCYFVHVF